MWDPQRLALGIPQCIFRLTFIFDLILEGPEDDSIGVEICCPKNSNIIIMFVVCGWFNVIYKPTCFAYSCSHLQGGENKNSDTIIMCRSHSRVKKSEEFYLWLLCNKITFMDPSSFFGLFKNMSFKLRGFVYLSVPNCVQLVTA